MQQFIDPLLQATSGFITLSPAHLDRLSQHFSLLMKWNRTINLTAITSLEEIAVKHYSEAIFLATCLPEDIKTVADIGSGAGFPGVPVSIVRPDLSITLIESDQRKAVFLKECGYRVLIKRAETIQEQFDCLISRAVDPDEVARLIQPRKHTRSLASMAYMLMRERSTWNTVAKLPWDPTNVVARFHVEHII